MKQGLKMLYSWTELNDLTTAEGDGGGKWVWTGRVKPSSSGSGRSERAAQN